MTRATEQRPSWGYHRLLGERLAHATAALDVQTGGGEVLAGVPTLPRTMVATESWPPNLARATALLHPRGAIVVADPDKPPLPFPDAAFDLVTSRHPATVWWAEIARVLRPGGTYLAQHFGPASVWELVEFFLGPQPEAARHLRKVIWIVPGFTVESHLPRPRALDELIRAEGPFVAHSSRTLVEARRPGTP